MESRITSEIVLAQLDRILNSEQLVGAYRIKKLLKFLVIETLNGRSDQIKGYTIAMDVFDRGVDFDPQSDPIVRITAARLRRHLDDYYTNCGTDDIVRITIPKGTYVPRFSWIQPSPIDRTTFDKDAYEVLIGGKTEAEKSAVHHDEPVIAVLPFTDLSGKGTPIHLLDGFSDELSTLLALFDDIRVIDYYSMAKLRGQSMGIREIGRQMGADLLISGSFKMAKGSIFIRTSLSETKGAIQIWTNTFERSLSGHNLANTLSEIVGQIISSVAGDYGVIFRKRSEVIRKRAQADLTHYEVIFKQRHAQLTGVNTYSPSMIKDLNRVLEYNPEYVLGWATLGEMYLDKRALEYSGSTEVLDMGYSFAQKAINLDIRNQYANFVLAYSHVLRRESEKAIQASERVLDLNPHAAFLVGGGAFWLCLAGDFERGLTSINQSIKLNPYYPKWFHHAPFLFHLKRSDYVKALKEAERFNIPEFYWSYIDKTVAEGLSGNIEAARDNFNRLVELNPDFVQHPRYYVSSFVLEEDLLEKMLEGLAKAGLQTK